MGRLAPYDTPLPDGSNVRYSLKERAGVWQVMFPDPKNPGKYVRASTNCTKKNDALQAATVLIVSHHQHLCKPATRKSGWDAIIADLSTTSGLREKSLETYITTIRTLRTTVDTAGPLDITPQVAQRFRAVYGAGTYSRSNKSDAKKYPRTPKTVENAIRRLSGLWSKYLIRLGYATVNPWADVPRPVVERKPVKLPPEIVVRQFLGWVNARYPTWPLFALFLEVKARAGCRTFDLCSAKSADLDVNAGTLTLLGNIDKTHRHRVIPLPPALVKSLDERKGPVWLWDSYVEGAKRWRPGTRNRDAFSARTLFWGVNNLFREFNKSRPGEPRILPHDLRRRAITLLVKETGSVDKVAEALKVRPETARQNYLDATAAFDGPAVLKQHGDILSIG